MSGRRRHGLRSRRFKREQKYTPLGIDLANGDSITLYFHHTMHPDGHIETEFAGTGPLVIEGKAVEVERRPERLLGGGE